MVQNEEEIVKVSLEVHGPDAAKENGNRPTTATLSAWSGGGKVHPNPAQRSRRESSLFGLERNYSIELTEQNGSKTVLVVANNTVTDPSCYRTVCRLSLLTKLATSSPSHSHRPIVLPCYSWT